jgi:hypothetical protein
MSSILHWHDERTGTEVCYYSDHVAAVRDERECHANEGAGPFDPDCVVCVALLSERERAAERVLAAAAHRNTPPLSVMYIDHAVAAARGGE